MLEIRKVRRAEDIEAARRLAWEFVAFLRRRYPEMTEEIDRYLLQQDFAGQLDRFAEAFGPPRGECLIGCVDGTPAGVVMLKAAEEGVCEMNRMFVRDSARGRGLGRRLAEALIREARALGYREIRLSALHRHVEALPLYRSLGFTPCAAFGAGGDAHDLRVVFMRMPLSSGAGG